MNYSDALIIYLAVGSPLAVYHFLRTGPEYSFGDLPRAILVLLVWPVYTIWLVRHPSTSRRSKRSISSDYAKLDAGSVEKVDAIRFEMEQFVLKKMPEQSVFDLREVFERYVGLMAADTSDGPDVSSPFSELTSYDGQSEKLNAICVNRRNRRLLEFHQILARNDFLTLVSDVSESCGQDGEFVLLALKLSSLVQDTEAAETLKVEHDFSVQSEKESPVINLENEVWTSKAPRQSAVGRI